MKRQISLSIATPCSENWSNFTPTPNGGFCSHCCKNVIDFTKMSDAEIMDYFSTKPAHVCGRFRSHQLKTYSTTPAPVLRPGLKWIHAGFLALFLVFTNREGAAKNPPISSANKIVQLCELQNDRQYSVEDGHVIRGKVVDEYGQPLPGVSIYLKGGSTGTTSDINGEFKFSEELKEGDILVFSYLGFETMEYLVPKDAPAAIEIPMVMLEMELMGEVALREEYQEELSFFENWWEKIKRLF